MRGGQWHHLRPHKRGCLPRLRPAPLFVHGWHRVGGKGPHRVACLRFIGRCKYRKSDFLLTAPPDNPTKWCLLRSSSRTLLRQQEMLMIQVILFDTLSAVSGEYELSGWVWNVHAYVVGSETKRCYEETMHIYWFRYSPKHKSTNWQMT